MKISLIVAIARNWVIGKDNRLPWYIPEDLRWFKKITRNHPVIMGRKTFESIGKPLPHRKNIIITRQQDYRVEGASVSHTLQGALDECRASGTDEAFVIGGESIFREILEYADRLYITLVHREYDGEVLFPRINFENYRKVFEEDHRGDPPFTFLILDR